jgi:trigger factor
MHVSVDVEHLKRTLKVEIPKEELEKKVSEQVRKMIPNYKMPGFRPGKVPEHVIRQMHEKAIRHEAAAEITRSTMPDAIKEASLTPMTQPVLENIDVNNEGPLSYTVSFEIAPEFEFTPLTDITFEIISAEVTDEKVDQTLENIRKQQANWVEVDREAATGDRILIDFEGSIDNVVFQGGSAKGFKLVLGSNSMIPGFEDALLGVKAKEERTININFPQNYHVAELAGKPAQFKVMVHNVTEMVLPEMNEALVKNLGLASGDLNELKTQVRQRLQHELDEQLVRLKKDNVFGKLLELHSFELPKGLVQSETEQLSQQHQAMTKRFGITQTAPDVDFVSKAEQRVKLGILVNQYSKIHDLKADPEAVHKMVSAAASAYNEPEQIIRWIYEKEERITDFVIRALENAVVEHIIANARSVEKAVTFDEAMETKAELI